MGCGSSGPSAARYSLGRGWWCAAAPGRVAVLEGAVLRPAGLIEDEPAGKACSGSDQGSEPGVPADGAGDSADAGSPDGARQRALLGRGHVGAGSDEKSEGREQQDLLHTIPRG
jgi:hypothetical protein